MRFTLILGILALVAGLGSARVAQAGEEDFKNLKVLKNTGKDFEKSMKAISKGLGVKCTACHVKGEFDSDKVPAKDKAREFFGKAIGEKDQAKKDAALADLLKAVEVKEAKDAASIWEGVAALQKK